MLDGSPTAKMGQMVGSPTAHLGEIAGSPTAEMGQIGRLAYTRSGPGGLILVQIKVCFYIFLIYLFIFI